jgi:hypothetical protein
MNITNIDTSKLTNHWSSILPFDHSFKEYALQFKTFPDFWNNCQDGKYLLFWAEQDESISRQQLVYTACQVARLVLHLVEKGEDRPRVAIETAERWCKGEAIIEEVKKVAGAAYIGYSSAYAAYNAAAYAVATYIGISAYDAAVSAASAAADAALSIYVANYIANNDVYVTAHAAAIANIDKNKMEKQTANIVRSYLPIPTQLINEYNRLMKLKSFW